MATELAAMIFAPRNQRRHVPPTRVRTGTLRYTDQITGHGSGAYNLDDLADVVITSAVDGQVLIYDIGTSTWINGAAPGMIRIAAGDTPGYAEDKIVAGSGIIITITGTTNKIMTISAGTPP
jgi:hypothetical protein